MANGVSCAFFAARNIVNGTKEKNVFKEGIGVAQTIRTADAAASVAIKSASVKKVLSGSANFCKAILYPLIWVSALFNTIKSKDKVKTGVSQSAAIGTMFAFEKLIEKNVISTFEKNHAAALKTNTKMSILWYILRGIIYASTSMAGYMLGSKAGETSVNLLRGKKEDKSDDTFVNNQNDDKENVFDEIELQ